MYYKIENKESEVYKQLHALRTEEVAIEKRNKEAIQKKIALPWEQFLGIKGQQNFLRVDIYNGFRFENPKDVDLNTWREHKDHKGIFVPNKRTKQGKEMNEFLLNKLESSWYQKPLKILSIDSVGKFSYPFIEISGDVIVMYLSDNHQPENEDVIEITSVEFNSILDKN